MPGESTGTLVRYSFLVSLGVVLHYLDILLPAPWPGARLGLANLVTLIALVLYNTRAALLINGLRTVVTALLGGSLFSVGFFLSFAGAVTSTLVMGWLKERNYFSLIGLSWAGAFAHNVAQLLVASLVVQHWGLFFYLPYLIVFAIPTGYIIGLTGGLILKNITTKQGFNPNP
ncbi:MAG: Gx transporter family protein [Thermincolia bacterium]